MSPMNHLLVLIQFQWQIIKLFPTRLLSVFIVNKQLYIILNTPPRDPHTSKRLISLLMIGLMSFSHFSFFRFIYLFIYFCFNKILRKTWIFLKLIEVHQVTSRGVQLRMLISSSHCCPSISSVSVSRFSFSFSTTVTLCIVSLFNQLWMWFFFSFKISFVLFHFRDFKTLLKLIP